MGWPGRAQRSKPPLIGLGGIKAQGACDAHPSEVVGCGRHDRRRHGEQGPSADKPALSCCAPRSRSSTSAGLSMYRCCLVGLEAGCGSHHIARQIRALGHDVRLIPAQYVKAFLKGHKNDYRDAEAIAEAVQRPTMNFVAIKTPEQSDLLSLHRVRSRLVGQRTAVINQIRGFLIERGITVRQGPAPLRKALPEILSSPTEVLSPRLVRLIADLSEDWRRLEERIEAVSTEIESLAENDGSCQRLMTVPGVGPIISSAVVAAIGNGGGFRQGRDFGAWLGLVPKQELTGDRTSSAKSPSAATDTSGRCSFRLPTSCWCGGLQRRCWVYGHGSNEPPSASPIAICWRSRSPTSSPASPGPCLPEVATTSRGSQSMPLEIGSLRFTKRMDATPLRHRRSPILSDRASERRWLRGDGFT